MSIEAIAAKVGYQDRTAIKKLVKREFGMTQAVLRGFFAQRPLECSVGSL